MAEVRKVQYEEEGKQRRVFHCCLVVGESSQLAGTTTTFGAVKTMFFIHLIGETAILHRETGIGLPRSTPCSWDQPATSTKVWRKGGLLQGSVQTSHSFVSHTRKSSPNDMYSGFAVRDVSTHDSLSTTILCDHGRSLPGSLGPFLTPWAFHGGLFVGSNGVGELRW